MRQILNLTSFFVLLAFLLFSCNTNVLRVTKFTPTGEVDNFQTFAVTFNKDVVSKDKLDKWIDANYLSFQPAISGKYKWTSPNTLVFSPAQPLKSGQDYKASFNKSEIVAESGNQDLKTRFNTVTFKTPDFTVIKTDIFYTPIKNEEYKLSVQGNVYFNYKVDPEALRSHLKVMQNKKEITGYTLMTDKPSDVIAIDFGRIAQTKEEQKFEIVVKKGLNSTLNKTPLKEDRSFSVNLPPIQRVAITEAVASMDEDYYTITVTTTQEIDAKKASKYITVTPALNSQSIEVESEHIIIKGKAPMPNEVKLSVEKGLPGLYGGVLENAFTEYLTASDVKPLLRFSDKQGIYLMRGGEENLKFETVNLKEVEVTVEEVFQNNMLFFFNNNYNYDRYRYDNSYGDEEPSEYSVGDYGKEIYTEEIRFAENKNTFQYATINLHKAINQRFRGIYVVSVRSDEDYYVRDAKIISFSDIGLIAKKSGNDLLVFANSIKTTQALPNVTVQIVSANNQTLSTVTTDAQGIAKVENLYKEPMDFSPRLLYASLGDDFNYLDMQASEVGTSRYEVGGKYVGTDDFDAFLYADRNIYRPGETIHLSGIVRNNQFGIVKDLPVQVKVITPVGKVFHEFQKTLNEQGSFDLDIETPEFAGTGPYTAELSSANGKFIQSYRFNIEEFAPDKIRATVDCDETGEAGGEVAYTISAEYLFGEPAKGHKYQTDVVLNHIPFMPREYKKFNFSNTSYSNTSFENTFEEGVLDDNGKVTGAFSVPENIKSGGIVEGKLYVSVFDVTGRTVNRLESFKIFPKEHYIGIKSNGYYFGTNKDLTFQTIAVNAEEKPFQNFKIKAKVVKYEWQTVLRKSGDNGQFRYVSEQKEVPVSEQNLIVSGAAREVTVNVKESGRYQLRIYKDGEEDYVYQDFYAFSYGNASASSFEIDKEGQIDIVLDKEKYQPGETVKALFITPFTGKMLVTIERESVLKHFYVEVTQNSTEIPIPVGEEYLPNVYISATLFKPHGLTNQDVPLLVGHGYQPVMVEKPSTRLPVTLIAPESVRPRTKQVVTVKTEAKKDIYVTLAAVDEGVLQVKNFKTPDPHGYMYDKRKLSVESYDLYDLLLPEYQKIASSAAGGDDYMSGKRQNPMKAKRFKLLALWSGIRKTDANGEVKVELDIPQFNGEIRLMAVAYEGSRFGSGDKPMKVVDEVVLMPAIPRTLTIGDSISMPVNVSNTTSKAGKVNVSVEVSGPLKVTSAVTQTMDIAANGSGNLYFGINTTDDVGIGKITLKTSGLGTTVEETEISVRPASSFVTESEGGEINAGTELPLKIPSDYVAGTQTTRITVSSFPALKYTKNLRQLMGYPYGCLEQITSKLFPQLYFAELAQAAAPDLLGKGVTTSYYVKEGIQKIQSMADYNGKINYWQGGSEYNRWASVYATHFLVEARKNGYEVDNYTMKNVLRALKNESSEKTDEDYVSYNSNGRTIRKIAPKASIYALYVLALAGEADISLMNYYRARPELLTNDTRYLLAGAFALNKNWGAYNELMPKSFDMERTDRDAYNFDSEIRANAIMLNVLLDVDPSNQKVQTLTQFLADKQTECYSTQENAWYFLAMGKAAGKRKDPKVSVEIWADGKKIKTLEKASESFSAEDLIGKNIILKASGTGSTFYAWNTEGIKKYATIKEEDKEFQVRRAYYDRKGNELKGSEFRQGDLIVCKITLNGGERTVPYVAVSDLIPSGFEIENPRLNVSADFQWIEKAGGSFSPDYMDVRDDRMLIFTTVNAKESKSFYYMTRVVNTGAFELPAITAEAMYNPNAHSYYGARKVRVKNG